MKCGRSLILLVLVVFFCGCHTTEAPPYEAISDYFWAQRAYPSGQVNSAFFHQEKDKVVQRRNNRVRGGNAEDWRLEGPFNIGGRITDVEMIPSSTDLLWVGSASGGAFKSEDQGNTWESMTELEGSPPIGDICVRPSNPQEVWVGTGETNGGSGSIAYEGFGVLKSMNGGRSWENVGLPESGSIGRIAMHPTDPATLYVAAMGYLFAENEERGVYKTIDGGQSWEKVFYLDNQTGASDVIIDPNNPDIIYASMWQRLKFPGHKDYGGPSSGVYKSEDGGSTWRKLNLAQGRGDLGRIGIAMAPSNSSQLYTLVINKDGEYEGIFVTTDQGENWTDVGQNLDFNYRTSGYWFCNLTIHPTNAEEFFVCGLDVFHLIDGGTRRLLVCDNMHVDQHSIVIHPQNPDLMFVGNDGGLYKSEDGLRSCTHYKNLPITQFYTCTLDPIDDDILYGGTQDNNPLIRRTENSDWENMLGGDGFVTLPHPRDNQIIYTEFQYGNIHRSEDGGYSWQRIRDGLDLARSNWNTPFMFNPFNDNVLFLGTHRVHRTDDGGDNWTPISDDLSNGPGGNLVYGTITSIDVSPVASEVMIAGTDDGNVWITNSAGAQWTLVSSSLPDRWVTRVVCHPDNVDQFYVTYSGLKWHDYQPHIFRSDDVGQSWADISNNLPEVPVNDLIIDPDDTKRYWAATDLGVFESEDEGLNWEILGTTMPVSIVNDIDYNSDTKTLLAGTYGRSMWSIERKGTITSAGDEENQGLEVIMRGEELEILGDDGEYNVALSDLNGRVLSHSTINVIGGRGILNTNSGMKSGILIVSIYNSDSKLIQSRKFRL